MKFSEKWIRQLIELPFSKTELLEQLNLLGLEVDTVEAAAPELNNVVVGQIVAIKPHPDADRLRICQVDAGEAETYQVVCGAANATKNLKAPFAKINAQLPGDIRIKKTKLRGVESFGMLCSEAELGLAEKADGLMALPADAPVGTDIHKYLELDDTLIEIDLTPNRGDCLSVTGVARELAVASRQTLPQKDIPEISPTVKDTFKVDIQIPEACPHYAGRIIKNINTAASTPVWMQEKLRRSGIRSISPVVDVSNYVMLELGQPMHAFDLDKLQGGIQVRYATKNEQLALLDGSEVKLHEDTVVIADHEAACALAGIMGGADSAVSDATRNIFLESAFFKPTAILGQPRRYGLHTDSSHRFERGVDPGLQRDAIERATELLLEIVGGEPGPITDAIQDSAMPVQPEIQLRRNAIQRVLGCSLDDKEVGTILSALGASVDWNGEGWSVKPPSYRFDLKIEVDLIEELARVYGYANIPRSVPAVKPTQLQTYNPSVKLDQIKVALQQSGYYEIVSYSFIDAELQQLLEPEQPAATLQNPISSELAVMRTNLVGGLLKTLQYNLHRQQKALYLYEVGSRYIPQDTDYKEEKMIAGLCHGLRHTESWNNTPDNVDFYDMKGAVERLIAMTGSSDCQFQQAVYPYLHPGQAANVVCEKRIIGHLGRVHPRIEQALDLPGETFVFQLSLAALLGGAVSALQPISKYPGIRRDIAILVDETYSWDEVRACIRTVGPEYLTEIRLFDVYAGENVTPGRKSLAIGLILQEISRTLTDAEIKSSVDRILEALNKNLGATLRE